VQLPDWWKYPAACEQGHAWGPGRVIVSWVACHCEAAVRAVGEGGVAGHRVVSCRAEGCRSAWFRPRCEGDRLMLQARDYSTWSHDAITVARKRGGHDRACRKW
jgi:hypothetical protein